MASKLPLQNNDNANVAKVPVSSRAAAGKTLEQMYQNKLELEQILRCSNVYIGSTEKHTQTLWVYENDEMVCRSVTYVPGLYKIFDEILVNAANNQRRYPSMDSVKVVIDVEKNLISVCNSGDGVPVEIHQEEGVYVPEMIFGHLLTSSNYDDNVKKTTGGRNGYGAKIASIFSTEFIIEIADGKRLKKYKQVFENNMGKKSEPVITNCNKSDNWMKVTFKPDLEKFNMTELENDVVALMSKRVFDIAGCLGKTVKVELNGKRVPIKSFSDYVDLYLSAANKSRTDPLPRMTEKVNDRWEVFVSLSDGQFQQVSFVNSSATIKGGTHVDYVTSQVTNYIVSIVNKKNKNANVKTHNVKNHLWVFVNALIDNPAFDSPTKETLTLPRRKFGSKCELSEDILKKVAKSGVVENLLSWATFNQSKELTKSDGAKTGRVEVEKLEDANEAGGKYSQKIRLTKGDSAKTLARRTHLDQMEPKITYGDSEDMEDVGEMIKRMETVTPENHHDPSTSKEGKEYFRDLGLHKKDFFWEDEQDGEAIELAFSKKKIEARQNLLSNYEKEPKITYSDQRSIPSMVDGLKSVQRKIIFCAFKRNFVKEARVTQFLGYVVEHSAYHHGEQSLASTIICMAQDYVGSNNVNLLQPIGEFGTRTSSGKDAASARYIFTKLSPATRALFPKDDDVLLDYLIEDGQEIEPIWYMPIIPTVLVNGAKGIGNGWSTFIPNYNPREIVANIRHLIKGESMVPMHPWYRGFTGFIEKTASKEGGCTYTTSGICEEVDETTLRIKELPIGNSTDDYRQFLNSMKADNGVSFIQSIKDNCDERSVDLQITLSKENLLAARKEGFAKKFKLTTTIATTNMHLLDKECGLKKYATPERILEEFFDLRLEYYEKRKEIMLKNLELELLKLENKVKFLNGCLSGEIVVSNNREKADFVQELRQRGFTPFPKMAKPVEAAVAGATDGAEESEESSVAPAPSSPFIPGSDYDYLLDISWWTMAREKVKELIQRDQTMVAIEDFKKADPRSLWLKDLEAFVKELDELDEQDAQAKKKRQVAQEKIRARKQAPKKTAPKKASEHVTIEASNSAMDTDNNVAEVVKPKGRQGEKRKAPAAKENAAGNSSSEESEDVFAAKPRPQRVNRRAMTYVLSDSESESWLSDSESESWLSDSESESGNE